MNQEELLEIIKKRIIENNNSWHLSINGCWGIGKSYCWNLLVEEINTFNKNIYNEKEKKYFIYVSFFGKESIEDIEKDIKNQYYKIKYGYLANKILQNSTKITKKITEEFLDKSIEINLLNLLKLDFGNNFIFCFDDLERLSRNINIQDIMGLIESYTKKTTLLLIYNYNLIYKKKDFNLFKEKILDFQYNLTDISQNTIENYIENEKKLKYENQYQETLEFSTSNESEQFIEKLKKRNAYKDKAINILKCNYLNYNHKNLRTLRKIIYLFDELINTLININIEVDEEDLFKLCIPLIIDLSIIKEIDKVKERIKPKLSFQGSFQNEESFYYKYKIDINKSEILEQLLFFIEKIQFNNLNKIKKQEIVENIIENLVNSLYNFNLYDTTFIKETINQYIDLLGTNDAKKFNSFLNIIRATSYSIHLINTYNIDSLIGSIDNLTNLSIEAVKLLIENKTDKKDYIKSIETLLTINFNNAENEKYIGSFFRKLLELIKTEKLKIYQITFQKAFHEEEYEKCFEIFENNNEIILNNLYIFNNIINQSCSKDYINFIKILKPYLNNNSDYIKLIIERLNELDVTDPIITFRKKSIIDYYKENTIFA